MKKIFFSVLFINIFYCLDNSEDTLDYFLKEYNISKRYYKIKKIWDQNDKKFIDCMHLIKEPNTKALKYKILQCYEDYIRGIKNIRKEEERGFQKVSEELKKG
jgi:hypothetical protein